MRNSQSRSSRSSHREPPRGGDASLRGGTCTAVIGSMTQAMKAQSLLAEAAIRSTVVKVSSGGSAGGCAYGVDLPCTRMSNAMTVLSGAGIRVREYLHG